MTKRDIIPVQSSPDVPADMSDAIAELGPWFHNLHLPGGMQTAPNHWLGDFPNRFWMLIAPHLPADLTGLTALDIGCNAGFYTIELARRGADVTAIDIDANYLHQAHWAAAQFGLGDRIHFLECPVHETGRWDRTFDIVLFMGVLYHLRYPLLALDAVRRRTGQLLVFQSLTLLEDAPAAQDADYTLDERGALSAPGWPRAAFIEHHLHKDPTNWWVPNRPAAEAMLRSSGFQAIHRPHPEIWICRPAASSSECPKGNEAEYRAALGLGPDAGK